ncbi:hypothetical protein [Paenibacillus sp. UNC451MF]|uniref:hypothetical protein n=1 Tax=Paenibacillus sp. UNC451MF TaxID=1449063 RepID=UPI00048D5859|nr:hypothetical protein [Paenibacillus sp. UNC451MF]
MTSIGLLCVTILTLMLLTFLDMKVYHESLGSALTRLSLGANDNAANYLFIAGALLLALIWDFRGRKQSQKHKKKAANGKGKLI